MASLVETPAATRFRKLIGANIFVIVSFLAGLFLALRQVPAAIDDGNYIEYFSGHTLEIFRTRIIKAWSHGFLETIFAIVLGEGIWAIFTDFLASVLNPVWCIRVLAFIINFGVLFSARRQVCPWIFMSAWIMLSDGMASLGYLQLRQGLALTVLLNLRNYPISVAICSLGIHRTAVYMLIQPRWISHWRRAIIVFMVMIFGIFASMDLLIANANRGDSTQWVHYSHLNVNWFLEMSLLLSLHITLLFDQSLSESSRWILSISAFIAGVSLIGFFFAPILTERFVYYPFILFAYIMSDVVQPDLNKMRALTIACLMSLGVIMLYDFLRFTLDSDFSRTFHSIL